ncbi:MAG TPA: hypothetical protein VLT33_50545 [Labilithrix sp.]|nr:hypothetical protein [Labilithrix sp.]
MFMRSHFLLTGALSVGSLASMGCSISATPDGPDAAESTASTATAVVVVERTTGPGDAVRADAVIARFVRVHQGTVDDQALRIAGAAWDLPAVGTCSAGSPAIPAALQPRSVDLLDVGVLTLGDRDVPASTKNTVLLPRTMFDPTGGVSGVFYSARSTESFTPSSRLQLHTSGGPDLPEGFLVNVASPREVSDVRVTATSSSLDVAWDADGADDARDLVYVDVTSPSARLVARCTTVDSGHMTVPATSLGTLEEGQLSVHRLHRESFRTKGIEPGEIRFDVARVVAFHR